MDPATISAIAALLTTDAAPAAVSGGPARCEGPHGVATMFWIGALEVKPGATVPLQPLWSTMPGAYEPAPAACVKRLTLSDRSLATLSADRTSLQVAANAPHGARFTVRARVAGRPVEGVILVVDPARAPLARTWRQEPLACGQASGDASSAKVEELVFTADGKFSVTWMPFESYRDYWGSYRYDMATGALEMTVEGGNRVPPDLDLSGEARVDPDGRRLHLSGLSLGQPNGPSPPASCSLEFRR